MLAAHRGCMQAESRGKQAVLWKLRSNPSLTLTIFTFAFIIWEIPHGDWKLLECKNPHLPYHWMPNTWPSVRLLGRTISMAKPWATGRMSEWVNEWIVGQEIHVYVNIQSLLWQGLAQRPPNLFQHVNLLKHDRPQQKCVMKSVTPKAGLDRRRAQESAFLTRSPGVVLLPVWGLTLRTAAPAASLTGSPSWLHSGTTCRN